MSHSAWCSITLQQVSQNACTISKMTSYQAAYMQCRAGFIAADVVLALLVAAFVISTLVGCARSLACTSCMDIFSTLWRRKVSLLLDCLTCAAMISSELLSSGSTTVC